MTKTEQEKYMLWGAVGIAAYFFLFRRDPLTGKSGLDNLFSSAGQQLISAPIDFAKGVGSEIINTAASIPASITGAIMPISACVAAMNSGDTMGVIWNCSIGTTQDWLANGSPTGCYDLADGKIYCPSGG